MSRDKMTRTLLKAASAAGYAMATREEDLEGPGQRPLDDALRNGHAEAASAGHRGRAPFTTLFNAVSHFVAPGGASLPAQPRALLTSR